MINPENIHQKVMDKLAMVTFYVALADILVLTLAAQFTLALTYAGVAFWVHMYRNK